MRVPVWLARLLAGDQAVVMMTDIVTRISIDVLRSARVRKEEYVGKYLLP